MMLSFAVAGQVTPESVEKEFDAKRAKLKLERFAEGEDASSGYDYLYYLDSEKKVAKVRVIWSATHSRELRIEDLTYAGDTTLLRTFVAPKRDLNALKRGNFPRLTAKDTHLITGGKLVVWKRGGVDISPNDTAWKNEEASQLERAREYLEHYKFLSN